MHTSHLGRKLKSDAIKKKKRTAAYFTAQMKKKGGGGFDLTHGTKITSSLKITKI